MPIVTVQQSPRDLDARRRLVEGITHAFVEAYGVKPATGTSGHEGFPVGTRRSRCSSTRWTTSTGPRADDWRSTPDPEYAPSSSRPGS
ncbi:4-oxalocrotonate tautomerase family protein [Solirubrobacter taibaiensis]|nr:4-oxalocrotonate tautomerase family protein [Solirubrobacter taibaiensis]